MGHRLGAGGRREQWERTTPRNEEEVAPVTTLGEQVESAQREHDAALEALEDAEGAIARDVEQQAGLFDGNVYDDPRLVLEHNGRRVTDIRVGFLGGLELGRHRVEDVGWFRSLREGQSFELVVSGTVTGTVHVLRATEKHGTQLIETRRLSIDSVEGVSGNLTVEETVVLRDAAAEMQADVAQSLGTVEPEENDGA